MLTFDFSGLQIYLRPGKVPFATVPNIRLARKMSDNEDYQNIAENTEVYHVTLERLGRSYHYWVISWLSLVNLSFFLTSSKITKLKYLF